ncbi:hypothetical protein AAGT13_22005 [Azotobacter salinestris]
MPRTKPGREKKPFKHYPLGYLHIDITETRTAEGKAYLFARSTAPPNHLHTLLTSNGIQFTPKPGTEAYRSHPFDALCRDRASNIS